MITAVLVGLLIAGCSAGTPENQRRPTGVSGWVYQLDGYPGGRLDQLARAPQPLAVIDLARDGGGDYFAASEIAAVRATGKTILAYFSIGSTEDYRPEHAGLPRDLILNRWDDWPREHFVRYWDRRWWRLVVRPRLDQALTAGFDGVYLDVPLAYEEIDPGLVPGETHERLARKMVRLITRISAYAKARRPGFRIFPQNSPELRRIAGYVEAIDGIGVEELFFLNRDKPCTQDFCRENLANTRALRDAGKTVLAVDYASKDTNIARVCRRYRIEGFAGYPATIDLDRAGPPCP